MEIDDGYLQKKHYGGVANEKGNRYEDHFVVAQIVSLIAQKTQDFQHVVFQKQLENAYVDDLLIAYSNFNVYHQLKNSKRLTWKTISSQRTIVSDFENQIRECGQRKENFKLKLIYSDAASKVNNTIPQSIANHTSTQYFPYEDDLNSLVITCNELKADLKKISVNGDNSELDELATIATVFLGVWKSFGISQKVRLADIMAQAERIRHFNLDIFATRKMSDECRMILNSIEGLEYSIKGNALYWSIGRISGTCPWNEDKDKLIIDKKPQTKRQIVELL